MRIWIGLILCVAAMWAADKPAARKSSAKPATKQQKARQARKTPVVIPPGAVQVDADTWHHTDQQGRRWVYRKTPWGMARFEDKQGAADRESGGKQAAAAENESESIVAFDDGEYVRFERRGPFGAYKWRTKKAELNDVERRAWERAQASGNAGAKQ